MHLLPMTTVPSMKKLMDRIRGLVAGRLGAAASPLPPLIQWTRAPAGESDRVLLSETHVWLRRIPSSLLPKHLCRLHPHLANRLAQAWGDKDRIEALVDDLLIDRRGGRKGFTPRVGMEIEQLERLHARSLADPANARPSLVPRRRMRSGVLVVTGTLPAGARPALGDDAQRSSTSTSRV